MMVGLVENELVMWPISGQLGWKQLEEADGQTEANSYGCKQEWHRL